MTKLKTPADVPALVDALIAESPDVAAIGDDSYCVVDLDEEVNARIQKILNDFGPRDHLFFDIIDRLKAKGRDYVLPENMRH
ncbi:hypothetical protein AS026_19440 [Rhizobium altiplani]|uniref:Uncharacterized protein n=1 Tax=Rhizobium altiplani TaxID=1864509 RepID=A0A109J7L8_9HYPH|nr:hypothetical protein [Rhizobium altiplani]KWV43846.1 hypothetical protein AS026_19440 [Rhizobium altiplani]